MNASDATATNATDATAANATETVLAPANDAAPAAAAVPDGAPAADVNASLAVDATVSDASTDLVADSQTNDTVVSATPTQEELEEQLSEKRRLEDEELVAPLLDRVNDALRYLELRTEKVKFYKELLEKLAKQGNQVIAQMHGSLQGQLVREGVFLSAEAREVIAMKISVLSHFIEHLF